MDYAAARDKLLEQLVDGSLDDEAYSRKQAILDAAEAESRRRAEARAVVQWVEPDRDGATVPQVLGPGFRIGKYRLQELIGTGGMGAVWSAIDTEVAEREVALKILPEALQRQPSELARFRQTFQLVEKLHHAHIGPLYELSNFSHPLVGWYQVMRRIRGRTLNELRDEYVTQHDDLPVGVVASLLQPVADALDYAHSRKVVHRDLKPENILVEGAGVEIGQVWLIDFGIAAEIRSTMTRASTSLFEETAGSREYLAPELFQARFPDAASDQYALAVVAYELLAGRPPFAGGDFHILRQAVLQEAVLPIDGLSDSVNAALLRGLSKSPGERFDSCREFVRALATEAVKTIAAPPFLRSPFSQSEAESAQRAWAKYLGRPVVETNAWGMKLVLIPPGEFMMGSPGSEADRDSNEHQHLVRITRPYYLGVYPVTQAEYQQVIGENPSAFSGASGPLGNLMDKARFADLPVEQVSWVDATEFCRELSAATGEAYRLPTEAEWEYACRAGTTTPYWFGSELNGTQANCDGNYPYGTTTEGPYLEQTTLVGKYGKNPFGLYELHGNVWEWCVDWYDEDYYRDSPTDDPPGPPSGSYKVSRGGSWDSIAEFCRTAYREPNAPTVSGDSLGFRLLLSVTVKAPGFENEVLSQTVEELGILEQHVPEIEVISGDVDRVAPPRPILAFPFSDLEVESAQRAWTAYLGRPVVETNAIGMKLALIPPGEFLMGSPESEVDRRDNEHQHLVRITRPYYLGVYPVTQADYERVMGKNPSHFRGANLPVESVSWENATEFCRKLSAATGEAYRLPTEAEWEYACRAGTTTPFWFGSELNGTDANCDGNYPYGTTRKGPCLKQTTPVGEYGGNPFGLYDVHGNVWEWCADWYGDGYYQRSPTDDPPGPPSGSGRVIRGGGWWSNPAFCRSAYRYPYVPSDRWYNLGFRLALSPSGWSPEA